MTKEKIIKLLIVAFMLSVFIFASVQVAGILIERNQASNVYDDLSQQIQQPEETEPVGESNSATKDYKTFADYGLSINFEELLSQNSDLVGWIYLPDNKYINYPVVRAEDNEYYLNHLFDGKVNESGSIFMDFRNDAVFGDDNTLIYGHAMKNKTMFRTLHEYKKQEYYDSHPFFLYSTSNQEYCLEVFAAYVTKGISDAYIMSFDDKEEDGDELPSFKEWYADVCAKNKLTTEVEVTEADRIVTLSTCEYSGDNNRLVVHCKVVPII